MWVLVFLVRPLDFWTMLTLSTLVLLVVALGINRDRVSFQISGRMVLLGVVSAFLLYALFYAGFQVTRSNPIFGQGVGRVYGFRGSAPSLLIGLVLVFPIGPSEEIYWRGLIQRRFAEKLGSSRGLLIATSAYTLVHLPTLNLPLILTALLGGFVWGYMFKSTSTLVPVTISHVLFDLLIFVIAPLS